MPAPPLRAGVSGTPSRATANIAFGALWDYVTGLLGTTGNAAEARQALGIPNTGPLSGVRNLLINGNFAINQRGYVSGTAVGAANTYTLDRWRVVSSGQSASFSASGNGNTVTAPAGGFEQVIEGASIAGGTYVVNWTGTATCTVGGTSRAKGATFTLTAGTNVTVRFSGGTVSEAQIEPGSVVTPFESRPLALEFSFCQRYFEVGQAFLQGQVVGDFSVPYSFKANKRATPTMATISTGTSVGVSASQLLGVCPESVGLQITLSSSAGYRDGWRFSASAEL